MHIFLTHIPFLLFFLYLLFLAALSTFIFWFIKKRSGYKKWHHFVFMPIITIIALLLWLFTYNDYISNVEKKAGQNKQQIVLDKD